ncbi:MAG: hypothetical protein R2794_02210 [Chitinophagales bacterium]
MYLRKCIFPVILLSFAACSPGWQFHSAQSGDSLPKGLYDFLITFEKATLEHDTTALLQLMDADYRKQQYEDLLQGRTGQFFHEFYCGEQFNGKGYDCLAFDLIDAISRLEVHGGGDSYNVVYMVQSEGIIIKATWTVTVKHIGKEVIYGMYGAVG